MMRLSESTDLFGFPVAEKKVLKNDLDDAFNIILFALGKDNWEEDPTKDIERLRLIWNKAVSEGRKKIVPIEDAKNFRYWHRRNVSDEFLNNPIIVSYDVGIVLDGSNRLAKLISLGAENVEVFFVSLPPAWNEALLDMD